MAGEQVKRCHFEDKSLGDLLENFSGVCGLIMKSFLMEATPKDRGCLNDSADLARKNVLVRLPTDALILERASCSILA